MSRRILAPVAGLITVLTLVTACGPGNAAISGKTPPQVLAQAISKVSAQSFGFTANLTLKVDLSKVSGFKPSDLGAFGPVLANGVTVSLDGSVESQSRALVHIKLQPLCNGDIYYEEYDGKAYFSEDGKTWYANGDATSTNSKTNEAQDEQSLSKVGFKDNGSTSQDGQSVEDYRLDFTNNLINQIAAASGQASSASAITQVVSVNGDGVDVYIRPNDGLPESIKGTLNLKVNVTELVSLLSLLGGSSSSNTSISSAAGTLGLSLSTDDRFTNYGTTTVSKPSVSGGTAPDPCSNLSGLGSLFSGLSGAGSSGSSSSGGSGSTDLNNMDLNNFNNLTDGLSSN